MRQDSYVITVGSDPFVWTDRPKKRKAGILGHLSISMWKQCQRALAPAIKHQNENQKYQFLKSISLNRNTADRTRFQVPKEWPSHLSRSTEIAVAWWPATTTMLTREDGREHHKKKATEAKNKKEKKYGNNKFSSSQQ